MRRAQAVLDRPMRCESSEWLARPLPDSSRRSEKSSLSNSKADFCVRRHFTHENVVSLLMSTHFCWETPPIDAYVSFTGWRTNMRVGVSKEIKSHEYRVGLTPEAAREYVSDGHEVLVETDAGAGIGAGDDAYARVGAVVLPTAEDVFASADMIVKVKEPQPAEWARLREGQILFTYLHLAPNPDQARGLLGSGCTAVAFETVTDARGGLPLLAPMSEVAGRLAVEAAGAGLRRHAGGRGLLLGGVPGVIPARIVVLGGVSLARKRLGWPSASAGTSSCSTALSRACGNSTSYSAVGRGHGSQRLGP